ncbi:phage tail protein [Paenibacillus caui]|uniref:phage tail protein n=1 Tax=Paenibacillus caui TaxID=2873927 RepID=UPI001CA8AC43|nr:phage tail protein [Paenibacillus caui]
MANESNLPLLQYTITTVPDPLRAGGASAQEYGMLYLMITSQDNHDVYCREINVYIPAGVLSQNDAFNPNVNTAKWQGLSRTIVKPVAIGRKGPFDFVPIHFECTDPSNYLINYPLVLTIGIEQVTQNVGSIQLYIEEISSTSTSDSYKERNKSFYVPVAAPSFFLRNFTASHYDSTKPERIPAGNFANGEPMVLSWEGGADEFTVTTAADANPLYTGKNTSVILSGGLNQTTTFTLTASYKDTTRSETLYLYDNLTVHITNADDTPNSLNVKGTVSASGFSGMGAFVPGMIMMWSGDEKEIPVGWALCNGQNGTPDLRDRFIIGAGHLYSVGKFGEPDQHVHTLVFDNQDPPVSTTQAGNHTHGIPSGWYANTASSGRGRTIVDRHSQPVDGNTQTQAAGAHSHNVTGKAVTGLSSGENKPKWYALCFLIYKGH